MEQPDYKENLTGKVTKTKENGYGFIQVDEPHKHGILTDIFFQISNIPQMRHANNCSLEQQFVAEDTTCDCGAILWTDIKIGTKVKMATVIRNAKGWQATDVELSTP